MKKRTYKRMKNRLYREIRAKAYERSRRIGAENRIAEAEETAEYYKRRFRKLGTNVDTTDLDSGNYVAQLKWELTPEQWGKYIEVRIDSPEGRSGEEQILKAEMDLAHEVAKSLIENNLIQFITKDSDCQGGPLTRSGTVGAKMYVVPWEQMPHKRTLEIRQMVDAIKNDREGIL